MTLIELQGLTHRYPSGLLAVDGVSLRIGPGASAIIGENGAGKTTLVKHLNGLLYPTAGEVLLDGAPTTGKPVATLARTVGLVFQNPNDQIFNDTVWREAAFGPRNLGYPPARVQALVEQALALVGLAERATDQPYDLTLSERKLLCIASVLAMDTPVVILDEPTTGQDRSGVELIGALVRSLREAGRTVIAVTHDMDLVADAFERTIAMKEGRVLLEGPTREVFAQPALLEEGGVATPMVARLAQRLGLPTTPLSVAELAREYRRGRVPVSVTAGAREGGDDAASRP